MHVQLCTSYALPAGTKVEREAQRTMVHAGGQPIALPPLQDEVTAVLQSLADRAADENEIDERLQKNDARAEIYFALELLNRWYAVRREVAQDGAMLRLMPGSRGVTPHVSLAGKSVRLSRFAYARRRGDELVIESPLAHAMLHVRDPKSASLLTQLAAGEASIDDAGAEAAGTLALLVAGGFTAEGTSEDASTTLRQWDFHDLLFHSRSRMGRHDNAFGGNFRFKGTLDPQPAVKRVPPGPSIALKRADIAGLMTRDKTLTRTMEERESVRSYSRVITLDELGEFLFRVARVKSEFDTDIGQFTKRPYPSGGGSYELELYLTVDRCHGLVPGMYYYAPAEHALFFIRPHDQETEGLLMDAWTATARLCRPQVLITIAARFQRVSWKYDSMAYATMLKNTGVLYQTMYLVATAMQLAPCGLGSGNSDRFCRAAGTDYAAESSIGEFALGAR